MELCPSCREEPVRDGKRSRANRLDPAKRDSLKGRNANDQIVIFHECTGSFVKTIEVDKPQSNGNSASSAKERENSIAEERPMILRGNERRLSRTDS